MPEEQTMQSDTAIIQVRPAGDLAVSQLQAEADKLLSYAQSRLIATDADLKPAVDDLSLIAKVKKALTEKKAEYVKPVKMHLDSITAVFQSILVPLDAADKLNRQKVQDYRAEQVRRQAEAEAINREKLELARREEALNGEHTVDLTPIEVPAPVVRVSTEMGTTSTMKVYKWQVVDFALVPNGYKVIDAGKVGAVVKASKGTITIPGIRVWSEDTLKVSTR